MAELAPERLRLGIRRKILVEGIVELWNRVSREVFKKPVGVSGFFSQSMPANRSTSQTHPLNSNKFR